MSKVTSLKKRTMTLSQLQLRTLDVLRKVRFQLGRQGYEGGMSDAEQRWERMRKWVLKKIRGSSEVTQPSVLA